MLIYLSVTLLVIPSPILMIISSEAIAIILSLKGFSAILIALSLAVGQSIGFSLLYFFSDAICERWGKLQKGLARLDLEKLKNRAWPLLGCASFFGFPPQNVSSIAASMVKVPYPLFISITCGGRFARYWLIAFIPQYFQPLFDQVWLPDWLTSL